MKNDRQEIRKLLAKINQAWLSGRVKELKNYFHRDVVFVSPGFVGRTSGKSRCVQSYKEFTDQATIRDFKESDHAIDVWGDTAVASLRFEIDYEMNDTDYHELGHDLFVLVRRNTKWLAVWRTMITLQDIES